MARPAINVWDPLVRTGHWLLAAGVISAWITRRGWGAVHELFGYGVLAIALARTIWGFSGPQFSRFSDFVKGPKDTLRYAGQLLRGREPRYIGHNPLGGWMIVALLLTIALTGASGWLYTTDRYWGVEWVERVHSMLADLLLALALLHVVGVVVASLRHRENLAGAMVHGRKRPDGR